MPDPVPLTGIFAKIRHLQQVGLDHYRAYSAEGRFLVDVDELGAEQVLASDAYRVTITRFSTTPSKPRQTPKR